MHIASIESLDREGRGVAHVDGKTVFIDRAVPGEIVEYSPYRKKAAWEAAQVVRVERESSARVEPHCTFFDTCGGCSMQHIDARTQVAAKQRVLEDALWHIGRVRPETMLGPVHGLSWGYRNRARLSARFVPKKGGALVGFRERKSTFVADMVSCEVLPRQVSDLIGPLRTLIGALVIRERLPQIEVAVGEESVVLVLRVLAPPGEDDAERLKQFAEEHAVQFWLQSAGPESARPFWPLDATSLYYSLPEYQVRIAFAPTDFTQVNHAVNRLLVRRTLSLLDPQPGERITDFFCGLGNFTLPIARCGANVLGVEGSGTLAPLSFRPRPEQRHRDQQRRDEREYLPANELRRMHEVIERAAGRRGARLRVPERLRAMGHEPVEVRRHHHERDGGGDPGAGLRQPPARLRIEQQK